MKNSVLILLVVFILEACATSKEITKNQEPVPPVVPDNAQEFKRDLVVWENQVPNIEYGDPLLFYNEFEININGVKPSFAYLMEDGILKKVNKSEKIIFTIPAKTPGSIIKGGVIKGPSGATSKLKISPFGDDENSYVVFSSFQGTKEFFLESKAMIFIDSIPYTVEATIKGRGDGKCRLFYDGRDVDSTRVFEKTATGRVSYGTKEIKIK